MADEPTPTFDAQGEGGSVWTFDVPKPGSFAEDRYVGAIRKGELKVIGDNPFEALLSAAVDAEPPVEELADPEAQPEPESEEGAPPKTGPGSSRDAWAEYAESLDVEVNEGMSRDDIVAAVEAD